MKLRWQRMACPFTPDAMAREFYYDTGGKKVGPVTGYDLLRLRTEGSVADDTWVRRANSSTWRRLAEVDLSKDEEEEANPSPWRLLTRHVSWRGLLLFFAVVTVLIALFIGLVSVAWPLLFVLLILWMLNRLIKG